MNKSLVFVIVLGGSLLAGALWLGGDGISKSNQSEGSSEGLDGDGSDIESVTKAAEFSTIVQNLMAKCLTGAFEHESFEAAINNMDAEILGQSDPSIKQSLEMERAHFVTEVAVRVKEQVTEWANGPNSSLAATWETNVRSVSGYLEDQTLLSRELRVATDIRWAYSSVGRSACDVRVDEVLSLEYNEEVARDLTARMETLRTQFASKQGMAAHLRIQILRMNDYVIFAQIWNQSIDLYIANEGKLPPHLRAASQYGLRIDKTKMLKYQWYKQKWLSEFGTI